EAADGIRDFHVNGVQTCALPISLVDLLQSVEAIKIAYAQALLVDRKALKEAQQQNDVVRAQEILQDAFRTDVRPLVAEARKREGGALSPVALFNDLNLRGKL